MSKTNEVRPIDANALLEDLQELLNQEVIGNTVSDVGNGIGIAMQRAIEMQTVSLNTLRDAIYEDAVAHGLWEEEAGPIECYVLIGDEGEGPIKCYKLIRDEVEELGSAAVSWETDYFEDCSDNGFSEELADVIIMCMSVAGKLGIDIDAAVKRKMEINRQRPWKHGKE
ncbi:MAG: MazG-like family protein [Candidatus Ventricola sp.]